MSPILTTTFNRHVCLSLLVASCVLGVWGWSDRGGKRLDQAPDRPGVPSYVKNDLCIECHPDEAAQWAQSHHFAAMAVADDATVLGNFKDARFEHDGVPSQFFRRDGMFYVRTDGSDGELADFRIAYTFGIDPLQQYLIERPGGRYQALTIAWDNRSQHWFDLYPDDQTPTGDTLHWTGRYQNWNAMCASCHSTGLRKGYDASTDRYATTWSEINVSCQSCHGPGSVHAAAARSGPIAGTDGDSLLVDFGSMSAKAEVDLCAACHSRRSELRETPLPGAPLYDNFLPALLTEDLYHPDGQQLGEVYEYGSFRQSKMYQAGVRCGDCHQPHSGKLRAQGNELCTGCHQSTPDRQRFPTLAASSYDSPAHHFHEQGSAGAQCVSCHMPARNYMVVHARRDHAIRIPRPDLSVKLGVPNPCADCHSERDPQWAAETLERWYGPPPATPHYGEIIAAARKGLAAAELPLANLAGDDTQPAIVRATALSLLTQYAGGIDAAIRATKDPDPGVRTAAVDSLERLPPQQRVAALQPLLNDETRAVRIAAARVLAAAPISATDSESYQRAAAEFVAAEKLALDLPGSHLNLAVFHQNQGKVEDAERDYRAALAIDPYFAPASLNLANLLNAGGRNRDAERALRDGLDRDPNQGELHYSLGLVLAEEKRLSEAAIELGRAAELMPARARVGYNHGLALLQLQRFSEAEVALRRALEVEPGNPDILYALEALARGRR